MTNPPDRRAVAEAVRRLREPMAKAVTEEFLRRYPDWLARYGELARERGLEDARFHSDFLAAAVEAGSPEAFARYALWTAGVLEARGIQRGFLSENLEQVGGWYDGHLDEPFAQQLRVATAAARAALENPPDDQPTQAGELESARSVFTQACLAGDRQAASTVAREAIRSGRTVVSVYVEILERSQTEVGRLWQANRISVAQEHLATAVTQQVIAELYADLERPAEIRGKALITGVEGELHQLGANMVADFLESDGWEVRFLGSNAPLDSVSSAVAEHQPDLVGISATMLPSLPRVTSLIEQLRQLERDRPLAIIVGGGLFRSLPDLWHQVGAEGFAQDLREVTSLARRLPRG